MTITKCFDAADVYSSSIESVIFDYQNIMYNASEDTTSISVNYTGNCQHISAQFFTKTEILNSSTEFPNLSIIYEVNATKIILSNSILATDPLFFRVIAVKHDYTICSNIASLQTFYRFDNRGIASLAYKFVQVLIICFIFS